MRRIKGEAGQTLLEVVVTVGVALIIIGSLVVLMNASTRRAALSRQANQASELVQEGLEIVRNIRDVDADGVVQVGKKDGGASNCALISGNCSFSDLYTADQDDPTTAYLSKDPALGCTKSWCLVGTPEGNLLDIFSRTVEIYDNQIDTDGDGTPDAICSGGSGLTFEQTKRITVKVTWHSPLGYQERSATTCLAQWQD